MDDKFAAQRMQRDAKERWDSDPIVVFEEFRDHAITLIEIVARVHYLAKVSEDRKTPLEVFVEPWEETLVLWLQLCKAKWWGTPLPRFLTRPAPILVDNRQRMRCRYDGSCYHEVAINFADGLLSAAECQGTASGYAGSLRFVTAQGDSVTDYLKSLVADIRCESLAGVERWKSETRKQPIAHANEANQTKLFPDGTPDDPDIRDLALRLDSEKGSGKTQLEIARELTGESVGNDRKAKRLLARIRMMKQRGKLNL